MWLAIDEWVSWKAAIMSHEFFVEPENPCSKASELRLAWIHPDNM
jgi:hypothetical protein